MPPLESIVSSVLPPPTSMYRYLPSLLMVSVILLLLTRSASRLPSIISILISAAFSILSTTRRPLLASRMAEVAQAMKLTGR